MPDLLATFGALIRAELKRRGVSQRQLATEIGTSGSTITRVLRGTGICDVETFLWLCDWLHVEPVVIGDEQWMAAYQHGRDDVTVAVLAAVEGGGDA